MVSFSQLPAVKKDIIFGAANVWFKKTDTIRSSDTLLQICSVSFFESDFTKNVGPYFVTALEFISHNIYCIL